jgi:hypothetical protein
MAHLSDLSGYRGRCRSEGYTRGFNPCYETPWKYWIAFSLRRKLMKLLIVALLLVGFHVGKSFAQQPLLTEDPQSLVSAQNASIQLYRENTAEVFDAVLAGKKSSNSDWYIVQRNGAGRDARIVLITNCSALSICSSYPNLHVAISAVCDTGCKADWLPPSEVYTWISLERTRNGYRFETKDAARKVVWTYWNIATVAATNFKSASGQNSAISVTSSEPSSKHEPQSTSNSVLDISSTPAGAEIEIDEAFVGNTPSSVEVSPGEHSIRISKKGFVSWVKTLKAMPGHASVSPELQPTESTKPQ